jgi:hypothetical protein
VKFVLVPLNLLLLIGVCPALDRGSLLDFLVEFAETSGNADYTAFYSKLTNVGGLASFDVPGRTILGNFALVDGSHAFSVKEYRTISTSRMTLNVGVDLGDIYSRKTQEEVAEFNRFLLEKLGPPSASVDYGYLDFQSTNSRHAIHMQWDRGEYRLDFVDTFVVFGTKILNSLEVFQVAPKSEIAGVIPLAYLNFLPEKIIDPSTNQTINVQPVAKTFVVDLNEKELLSANLELLSKIDSVTDGAILTTLRYKQSTQKVSIDRTSGRYTIEYFDNGGHIFGREVGIAKRVETLQKVF